MLDSQIFYYLPVFLGGKAVFKPVSYEYLMILTKILSGILSIGLALWLSPVSFSLPTQAETVFSREQSLAIFDDVWQTILDRYYDPNLRGVNWLTQRTTLRDRAATAKNPDELYGILRFMLGELRDSHTRIYSPTEKSDWRSPKVVSVGLSVREIEGLPTVTGVEKDSFAEKSGFRVGNIITTVDGVSVASAINRKISEQRGASTTAAGKLRAVATIFEGKAGTLVEVGWQDENGKLRQINLRRDLREFKPSLRARRIGNSLVVAFDVFVPETLREFMETVRGNSRGLRGIVLDLRGNRGGSAEIMNEFAALFLPAGVSIGNFTDRKGATAFELRTRVPIATNGLLYLEKLPIVVLTGTNTASAAEILASTLKQNDSAKLIGTTTCGCVLAIRRQHGLPDGGVLEISELDFKLANGKRLEGIGITPDEQIELTRKDLINRRDRALERAVEVLKIN